MRIKKCTASEKMGLCEKWKVSGLSKSEFSRQNGLRVQTFHSWLKKFGYLDKTKASGIRMLPINIVDGPATSLGIELEMIFPSGANLRIKGNNDIKTLQTIVRELNQCN